MQKRVISSSLFSVAAIGFAALLVAARQLPSHFTPLFLNNPEKVGIGMWETEDDDHCYSMLNELGGVQWHYNWMPSAYDKCDPSIQHIPMIWGRTFVTDEHLNAVAESSAPAILGFNEPDHGDQAEMSVEEALEHWPKIEAAARRGGKRIGSPATAGDPLVSWMPEFMDEVEKRGLQVDFICLHPYHIKDAEDLRAHLTEVYARWQRPIWITEIALADWEDQTNHTNDEQAQWLRDVLIVCDELDFVERVAWFGMWPYFRWDWDMGAHCEDGNLTPVGQVFRSLSETSP